MKLACVCETCGNPFVAIKSTQRFCQRKCFKRAYYLKQKKRAQEQAKNPQFPTKVCPICNHKEILKFDPIKFPKLFESFACPNCHVTNELIWDNIHKPNSKQKILALMSQKMISAPADQQTFPT